MRRPTNYRTTILLPYYSIILYTCYYNSSVTRAQRRAAPTCPAASAWNWRAYDDDDDEDLRRAVVVTSMYSECISRIFFNILQYAALRLQLSCL